MINSAVFIDAGYLSELLKIKGKPRIDYLKLSTELTAGTARVQTLYYDALPIMGTEKGNRLYRNALRFHHRLNSLDKFQVKLGRLQQDNEGGFTQKGVDMRLGIDLVQMSMNKEIEKGILITADSDFEYAVLKAKAVGTKIALAYFPISNVNSQFKQSVDEVICIDDNMLDRCKL